jgi:threonine synthase
VPGAPPAAPIADLLLRCARCAGPAPTDLHVWRCVLCRGPLVLPEVDLEPVTLHGEGVWRYSPWLPPVAQVTLGEARTPLVPWQGGPRDSEVMVKHEGVLPTGSFKDRGAAVLVGWLKAMGAEHVVEDSSGNAGAALAAYCARAGIGCDIYVPSTAPAAKLAQLRAYGARTIPVAGTREDVTTVATGAVRAGAVYASHAWNPLFLAGTQTFAFELWEQMGHAVPDVVVVPTGGGALLLGAHLGFAALCRAGLIDRPPRLVAAQAAACAPLADAIAGGLAVPEPATATPSLADGIQVSAPVRGREILTALRETGGTAVALGEADIAAAHRDAALRGLLVERTAAVGLAALMFGGVVGPGERAVVVTTGHGLKTPPA